MKEQDKKKLPDRVKEQTPAYPDPAHESEFLGMEYERFEIIEGEAYDCSPAPAIAHQRIAGAIYIMLHTTCHSGGTILFSPVDVYLDERNLFEPDIVYITQEREFIIKEKRIEGAPDLVVEILSPSSSQNDKIRKKRQYERHGVQEYWIVDPVHKTIDQFVLEEGKFVLWETYGLADTLVSPRFPCISIPLGNVFPPSAAS